MITAAESAGSLCPEPRGELFVHLDASNIDLKCSTEDVCRGICGGALAPGPDAIEDARRETRVWLKITSLFSQRCTTSTQRSRRSGGFDGSHCVTIPDVLAPTDRSISVTTARGVTCPVCGGRKILTFRTSSIRGVKHAAARRANPKLSNASP